MAVDPIEQFQIHNLFPIAKIGHTEIAFTNSAAFMLAAVVGITAFLVIGTAKRGLVPSRLQSAAEIAYEFVATTVRSTAGSEGMRFFPFVFTLFMFILTVNLYRPHSLYLHRHQPHHRHRRAGDHRVPHRAALRAHTATACTSSTCSCRRACRSTSCR